MSLKPQIPVTNMCEHFQLNPCEIDLYMKTYGQATNLLWNTEKDVFYFILKIKIWNNFLQGLKFIKVW